MTSVLSGASESGGQFEFLHISAERRWLGRTLIVVSTLGLLAAVLFQSLYAANVITIGFETWRPILYVYIAWAVILGTAQVIMRGEDGQCRGSVRLLSTGAADHDVQAAKSLYGPIDKLLTELLLPSK